MLKITLFLLPEASIKPRTGPGMFAVLSGLTSPELESFLFLALWQPAVDSARLVEDFHAVHRGDDGFRSRASDPPRDQSLAGTTRVSPKSKTVSLTFRNGKLPENLRCGHCNMSPQNMLRTNQLATQVWQSPEQVCFEGSLFDSLFIVMYHRTRFTNLSCIIELEHDRVM